MSVQELALQTPRLDLVASTLTHVQAEIRDPQTLGLLLGAVVPPGWPPGECDLKALEYFRDRHQRGGPSLVGWLGWYAMTRDSRGRRQTLVAGAGFFGPPASGFVEIGYSVIPEARGLGYAGEIVEALVTYAFGHPDVRQVIAHTAETNAASERVLTKSGFHRIEPGPEPGTLEYCRERARSPD